MDWFWIFVYSWNFIKKEKLKSSGDMILHMVDRMSINMIDQTRKLKNMKKYFLI